MINTLIAAALLAGTAPGIRVDVGQFNAKTLPVLKAAKRPLPTPAMVEEVEKMLASGMCKLSGQSLSRFDITVPYAVLVEPDGKSSHVVVREAGCEPLESYVGMLVIEMARQGDFTASAGSEARWYRSELNFNLE